MDDTIVEVYYIQEKILFQSCYIGHIKIGDLLPMSQQGIITKKSFEMLEQVKLIRSINIKRKGSINSKLVNEEETIIKQICSILTNLTIKIITWSCYGNNASPVNYFYKLILTIRRYIPDCGELFNKIIEQEVIDPLGLSIVLQDKILAYKYIDNTRSDKINSYKLLRDYKLDGVRSLILLRFSLLKELLIKDILWLFVCNKYL